MNIDIISLGVSNLSGLLGQIIDEVSAEQRRQHELKIQELKIIENSELRDEYVKQLLLDKFLAPIESAQYQIQNTAKHAQWLAEMVSYYHTHHGLSQEQAKAISTQLRVLAVKITQTDSLHDLKLVYTVATLFTDQLSVFKHNERKYSLEREMRKGILEPLNTCIATTKNFQRRLNFAASGTENIRGTSDPAISAGSMGSDV